MDFVLAFQSSGTTEGNAFFGLIQFVIGILIIVAFWRIFVKAGYPGWQALIPILNTVRMFQMGGRSGWWTLLVFVPLGNIVAYVMLVLGVCKAFGKGTGYALLCIFFPFIGFPMLGFGDATYTPVVRS